MCRLLAFIGGDEAPMLLADVVLWPDRSIVKQSWSARERLSDPTLPFHLSHGSLNGDGFGIGWFSMEERRSKDPTPCVFTSITPAWNNENLARLACKIVSPLIFAHVRAAYPGMPVSEQNCHPFMFGRYLWMHNGVVAGFSQIKRGMLSMLSDVAYNSIQSFHSDSAVSFALFLHHLPDPYTQQPPQVLLKAMQDTIHAIGRLQREAGINATNLLNYVLSDGSCLLATRFVSPATHDAASLYYAEGAAFNRVNATGSKQEGPAAANCCVAGGSSASSSILHEASYDLAYGEQGSRVAFVASEPITGSPADWVAVPKNMALVITREKGGYCNIMRAPLTVSPEEQAQQLATLATARTNVLTSVTQQADPVMLSKSLVQGPVHPQTGSALNLGLPHHLSSFFQPEVAVCLEAVSRGRSVKSRPWFNAAPSKQAMFEMGYKARMSQEGAGPLALTSVPASANLSRNTSLSMPDTLVTAGLTSRQPPVSPAYPSNPSSPFITSAQELEGGGLMPGADAADTGDVHFQRLVGHTGAVLCMATDEAAQKLYTASVDCTVKIWSMVDNRLLGSVTAGKKPVTAMQLRGRWLYTGAGRKLRVWDTARDCICVDVVRIANHCGNVRCLLPLNGRVYLGCQDASIKGFVMNEAAWRESDCGLPHPSISQGHGKLVKQISVESLPARDPDLSTPTLHGHVSAINALVCSSNGELIISAAGDAMIRVWRAADLSHVRTLRGHRGSVLSLLVIENLLVSGARDNTIRVWDLDMDLMCRCTLTGHKDDVTHLTAFTVKTPAAPMVPQTHPTQPGTAGGGGLRSNPSQTVLPCTVVASASADGTVRLWSLTWTCLCILASPDATPKPPPGFMDSPTTTKLLPNTGISSLKHSENGAVNGHGPDLMQQQPSKVPAVLCCAMTGSLVCAGYSDSEVKLWPSAGVHLLALHLVAADLGLKLPAQLTRKDGAPAAWQLNSTLSPSLLSPGLLSPLHPLLTGISQSASQIPDGLLSSDSKPGAKRPQTLAQSNLSLIHSIPAQQPLLDASLPTPTLVLSHRSDAMPVGRPVPGALDVPLPDGAPCSLGSPESGIVRSSGSHHLDVQMLHSLGSIVHGSAVYSGQRNNQLPGVAGQGRNGLPDGSLDGSYSNGSGALQIKKDTGNGTSTNGTPGVSLLTKQLGMAGLQRAADQEEPSAPAPVPSSVVSSAAAAAVPQDVPRSPSGGAWHVDLTGDQEGDKPQGFKAAFGSFMGVDQMESLYRSKNPPTAAATSQASSTPLESCDENNELLHQQDTPSILAPAIQTAPSHATDATGLTDASAFKLEAEGSITSQISLHSGNHSMCGSLNDKVAMYLAAVKMQLGDAPGGGVDGLTSAASQHLDEEDHKMGNGAHTDLMPEQIAALSAALEQHLSRAPAGGVGKGTSDMLMESSLREFVSIPTVSSNPRHRDDCVKGAKFLAKLLESLGADVKVVRPYDDKNPVVIGRLGHDPSKATVCFYGHYDVQPAQEPDWRTNPFELNAVNEYLYGRGTSDNKGPVLAFIYAVKELMDEVEADETGARCMPINIVFIFEGEEENGSIGFREAVTQNLHWFEGVQLIVISNTNWVGESVPCLTYGMRGMISCSVTVTGPQRDVHSGNDGGVFCEPMMDLIGVMSTLMQPGSTELKIPGFQDQVAPGLIDLAWSSIQQHGPDEFSREGYQASLGVPRLTPPPGTLNLLDARWCRPSLSVVDMRPAATTSTTTSVSSELSACYRFGPTRFSVIPATAVAKISVRFVAHQHPKHIINSLRDHVHKEFDKLNSPNKVAVHVDALGNWWEADVSSKWMMMAEAAIRREWGCEPLYVREGGTMPVASVLERLLSAPAIMIPMGQASDSPHLANERIRRINLIKGKGVIRALLEEIAGFWHPDAPSRDLAAAAAAHSGHGISTCPAFVDQSVGAKSPPPLEGSCGTVREPCLQSTF